MRKVVKLLIVTTIVVAALWVIRDRPLKLSLTMPPHKGGGPFWDEEHFDSYTYPATPGRIYVHRLVGTAYTEWHKWSDSEEVLDYVQAQLQKDDWTRSNIYSEGDPSLPETNLLDHWDFRVFTRRDDPWGIYGRMTIAAWRIGSGVDGFHVVVASARPSLVYQLYDEIDD